MASHPDVLQSCLQEAAKAARPALERCIEEAVAILQAAELQSLKVAERDDLARAWRELQKHKPAWSIQYPADLLVIFKANTVAAAQAARLPDSATPAAASGRAAPKEPTAPRHVSPEQFSLVDDADVSQAIESARLLQQVLPPVEQVLAELNSLVSTLQGLPNVRPDLNPLRPEAFALALRGMVVASAGEPEMASLWLRHVSAPLGRELKKLYGALVTQLERANVQGASYRVLQTPASASRPRAPGAGDGTGKGTAGPGTQGNGHQPGQGGAPGSTPGDAHPSQYADLSNYEIKDALFQNFLFHGGGNAHHGLAPSYYRAVDDELAQLEGGPESAQALLDSAHRALESDLQRMPAVDRPQRHVDERSPLNEKTWGQYGRPRQRAMVRTQLKKEAKRVGQVLGLEVVRKLVNQVAQDVRLLVPVREAIVALEPSLLRLAMLDPRFFSDERHPGRRIMEQVAQRSFKYNDEYGDDFLAFFGLVTGAFNQLNAQAIADAQPFAEALAGLQGQWDAQDQEETSGRNDVLQALRFAEERQAQADQIAFDLSSRADLDKVPGLVLDFLFGPWALAMAHARLVDTRNQVDPLGFGSVVPDLLWSVKRDVTLKRPAKLIEMIPSLLGKLHAGLELLGQEPKENEAFFEGLMRLHRPVLKLRRMKSLQDAEESGSVPLDLDDLVTSAEELPATPEQRRAKAAAHPWLGRDDLDAAGFEDTLPSAPGDLTPMQQEAEAHALLARMDGIDIAAGGTPQTPAAADPATAAAVQDSGESEAASVLDKTEAENIMLGLRAGHWVDLYSHRQWLRAQLIWASTKGTLFMFVSHGGQPHSMTKRSCERLIRERLLRPVDSQGVVGQALEAVAAVAAVAAQSGGAAQSGAVMASKPSASHTGPAPLEPGVPRTSPPAAKGEGERQAA